MPDGEEMILNPLLKVADEVVKLLIAPCCTKNDPLLAVIDPETLKVVILDVLILSEPFVRVKFDPTENVDKLEPCMIKLSLMVKDEVVKLPIVPCCNKNAPLLAVIDPETLKVVIVEVLILIEPFVRVKFDPTEKDERLDPCMIKLSPKVRLALENV
ncbi:MAG: hypothetical protein IPN29_15840 [Saprospiraceae bacterium]|nr:hypothetical protein [Saprospiraceae bacterium]